MPNENSRLLLEIDAAIREINRRHINPAISALTLSDLNPVIEMVARARASYLQALFEIATKSNGELPGKEAVARLHALRMRYEELVKGMQALETAVEREYLDVRKR
ncbi:MULTISPECIES: hypothetical protein [Marichromatium]|uniref:Uncharacterized protein n=1 Tax=Marichromatium gracile TaxID=1048 RepID=A0A4R4A5K3_MARGR|nr:MULTISPECIES: hypothetical protein [Marichromatium]MBO8086306.1 hypothetical protein [Marichromatium sp.]MBK1709629.1 hypothetical protein [Marichromatium gracile]RNE90942.1 hypothetical protein EBL84_04760 [Marichromatium sp. AB31]RNE93366.1 hypothetical protein EBL85_07435 [Marichromatium sp. AB32]TCW34037.1 hypothetical protein EDC29_11320 [Marichromatium gracile]